MNQSSRFSAFIAYFLPVIGWLYVGLLRSKDKFAIFHLHQSLAIIEFLALAGVSWAVVAWALAWIPFAFIFGMALFALVIIAVLAALAIWIVGMLNALRGLENRLPVIGRLAERLPISGLR